MTIICIVILIIVITTLFHNYTDSNIFMYNSCKEKLEQYLSNNYSNEKFNIVSAKYTFESENGFKFKVQNMETENSYNFVVYVDNELNIYDGIAQRKKSKEEINLTKKVENIKDSDILTYSNEVCDIIETIMQNENFSEIRNVNISLIDKENKTNSRISTIYIDSYKKNNEEGIQKGYTYIMKSLNIEYID